MLSVDRVRAGHAQQVVRGSIGVRHPVLRVARTEQGGALGRVIEAEKHRLPGRLHRLLELHPVILKHHHARDAHLVRARARAGARRARVGAGLRGWGQG